jgi:hypothetical protein
MLTGNAIGIWFSAGPVNENFYGLFHSAEIHVVEGGRSPLAIYQHNA